MKHIALILSLLELVKGEIEPFIVGGNFTKIELHPHSAFLAVHCINRKGRKSTWVCGASILNQRILLTAAHCLDGCEKGTVITITMGDEDRDKGFETTAHSYMIHENYETDYTISDIGMIKTRTKIKLNSKISRVAIMKNPPRNEVAELAGWGLVNEIEETYSPLLKSLTQYTMSKMECIKLLGPVAPGTLCAMGPTLSDYAAPGDSGSALMIQGHIQIGLVSYKMPAVANNLIIYTDVAYFYNWIKKYSKYLYCS